MFDDLSAFGFVVVILFSFKVLRVLVPGREDKEELRSDDFGF